MVTLAHGIRSRWLRAWGPFCGFTVPLGKLSPFPQTSFISFAKGAATTSPISQGCLCRCWQLISVVFWEAPGTACWVLLEADLQGEESGY